MDIPRGRVASTQLGLKRFQHGRTDNTWDGISNRRLEVRFLPGSPPPPIRETKLVQITPSDIWFMQHGPPRFVRSASLPSATPSNYSINFSGEKRLVKAIKRSVSCARKLGRPFFKKGAGAFLLVCSRIAKRKCLDLGSAGRGGIGIHRNIQGRLQSG